MPTQNVRWSIENGSLCSARINWQDFGHYEAHVITKILLRQTTACNNLLFLVLPPGNPWMHWWKKTKIIFCLDNKENGKSMVACRQWWWVVLSLKKEPKLFADWPRTVVGAIWTWPPYDHLHVHPGICCSACLTHLCTILCFSSMYNNPPKSIHCSRSVNTTAGSENGNLQTDQTPDKIGWALKGLAADGHAHTHTQGTEQWGPSRAHS